MREKLQQLIVELNKNLVGKEDVMKLSLLTMLAGENLILFGPPGTAKSEIARRLSKVFEEDSYFEYLLTKFTTPEEIFGPLSIQELKADRFKRNVEGYMPNVKIAFLDEIFKANSSILNSLLTIINEKVYHNGNEKIKVPLQSLISASNELPIGDNELSALYDRFLVRVVVDYLADDDVVELFDVEDEEFNITDSLKMKIKEIEKIKQESKDIEIPEEIRACIMEIRKEFNNVFKEDKDEVFSDRKFVKIMKFLKVSAYTNGRDKVDLSDIMLLINCLWNRDNNVKELRKTIRRIVQSHVGIKTRDLLVNIENEKKTNFDLKGEGTEYNPFLIEDINDLIHINNSNYLGKGYYFEQTGDIDLSSVENWISIGESEKSPFIGHYNGNSFKVLNLKGNGGLFGVSDESSSLINMKLVNINILAEKYNSTVGGLINLNKGIIKNCSNKGNISFRNVGSSSRVYLGGIIGYNKGCVETTSNLVRISCVNSFSNLELYLGGLVGYSENGDIKNCFNKGMITFTTSSKRYQFYIGGLVGHNENGSIEKSYNMGDIVGPDSGELFNLPKLGGIVGSSKCGRILNAYNTGTLTFYSALSGGIVGKNENGSIENCYNIGNIYSSELTTMLNSTLLGGIAGFNDGTIVKCVALNFELKGVKIGKIYASDNKANIRECYTKEDMILHNQVDKNSQNINIKNLKLNLMDKSFFSKLNWDFNNIWYWDNDLYRPILQLENHNTKVDKLTLNNGQNKNISQNNIWL